MSVVVTLHGDLQIFLPRDQRGQTQIRINLDRRTSIKDLLEAQGIPHPEIYRLTVDGREKDFSHIVAPQDRIEVFHFSCPVDLRHGTSLRQALQKVSFAVDVNVAKLSRLLRMSGFDTFYDPGFDDAMLAEKAGRDEMILLTRDRALLKRKIVVHGRMIRNSMPAEQLKEVVKLYGLQDRIKPFSRCLECNGVLLPVKKDNIIERLKPLTRKYYEVFHFCPACDKIFWPGSHRAGMLLFLKGIYNASSDNS